MKTLLILLFTFFAGFAAQDYLEFRNGETAKVTIIDTSDCFVTFERNGNKVSLKKEMFKYIVFWEDTTDLSSYICKNNIRKNIPASINYRDFLYSRIQSLKASKKPGIAKGSKVAVCNAILSEAMDSYSWELFKDEIANKLDKSVTVSFLPLENCANLDSIKAHYDFLIAFINDKQSNQDHIRPARSTPMGVPGFPGVMVSHPIGDTELKKLKSHIEIGVINLSTLTCEYKKTITSTRNVDRNTYNYSPEEVRKRFSEGYHKAKAKSIHNHMSNINRLIRRQ